MPSSACGATATCDMDVSASPANPETSELPAPRSAEQLRIVIAGHVDHGKSTLIGRLFHDSGSLPEGKLQELQAVAARRGVPFEWANLMDALQAERDQNITIDTAQRWFRTAKRPYVIIDAPGHKEFLRNMVTGSAGADAALLLIDAQEGVQENSRRHGYLLHLLGIRQLAVLINKMDLVGYRQERYDELCREYAQWLQTIGLTPRVFAPISSRQGDNICRLSENMSWWSGPTVMEILDGFTAPAPPLNQPLRFAVQDVYRFDHRRIIAGRIESGRLNVGDTLVFAPSNKASVVKSIEMWNAPPRTTAVCGESVGITLSEQIFVSRGTVAALESAPPYELASFKARIFWLGKEPLRSGKTYKLKVGTQSVDCVVESIQSVVDASTLNAVSLPGAAEAAVGRHEVGDVTLHTRRPVAFDVYAELPATGRFVLQEGWHLAGGGIVLADEYPRRTHTHTKSDNIFWSEGKVTARDRERRNGHIGCVLWLTGLSSSGKSTIATELERQLFQLGRQVYVLDGDNIRHGLGSDLGFSPEDRAENIRRIGEVAKLFANAGFICVTAFISPYRSDRDGVRRILPEGRFIEVYVNAPLEVCERRDPKGLYAKARAKEIPEFTGISAPYEEPLVPELELRTDQLSLPECVHRVLDYLDRHGNPA